MDRRQFPMQQQYKTRHRPLPGRSGVAVIPAGTIPWELAEIAYEEYSRRFGKDQSLERLAERGGFGWFELAMLLLEWEAE